MRWWNLSAAKRDLISGELTSRQLLPYVLAFGLLETGSIELSFLAPVSEDLGTTQILLVLLTLVLTVLGLLYVYRENGGAVGKQFLERLLVLGWVTGIRFAVFLLLLFVVTGALAAFSDVAAGAIDSVMGPFLSLSLGIYYVYLGHHVASIANGSQDSGAA